VKSWQRRFESLFRPGGGRGNESRSLFILLAVVALAVFILSGFFQIKAAEQGVILRFGKCWTSASRVGVGVGRGSRP